MGSQELEQRLLSLYSTTEQLGRELSGLVRSLCSVAKATDISVTGSIDQQVRERIRTGLEVQNEVDNSLRTQTLERVGEVFTLAQSANVDFPSPVDALSAIYPGVTLTPQTQPEAFPRSEGLSFNSPLSPGLVDPGAFRCDNGSPLPNEYLDLFNAYLQQCLPLIRTDPIGYATCRNNIIGKVAVTSPCINAFKGLIDFYEGMAGFGGSGGGGGGGKKGVPLPIDRPITGTRPGANDPTFDPNRFKPGGGQASVPSEPVTTMPGEQPGEIPLNCKFATLAVDLGLDKGQSVTGPDGLIYTMGSVGVPCPDGSIPCDLAVGETSYRVCAARPKPEIPERDCIPICGVSTDSGLGKPAECSVEGYKTEGGVCYVIPKGGNKRNPNDQKIAEGSKDGIDLQTVWDQCKQSQRRPETPNNGLPGGKKLVIPGCNEFPPLTMFGEAPAFDELLYLIGIQDKQGNAIDPSWVRDLPSFVRGIVSPILRAISYPVTKIAGAINSILAGSPCASTENQILNGYKVLLGFIDRWIGDGLSQVRELTDIQSNYLCPTQLPTPADAARAYLGNSIDAATLECWTRAGNVRYPEFARIIESDRSKLTPADLISLWRRGELDDASLNNRLREVGYLHQSDYRELRTLGQQIPPVSDLTHFMVRDAGDETAVKRFGMDDEYENKFTGRMKQWARAQGIDETYMKYVWRSHWSLPSPTQLFEFYHRLRYNPDFGGEKAVYDNVRNALIQQDILPFWIPYYLAVSFRPLTRIDARRIFDRGLMNETELKAAYIDQGYNDDNAERLTKFFSREKNQALLRKPLTKDYIAGLLSESEFTQYATELGETPEAVVYALKWADRAKETNRRKACIKSYRKRYLTGDYEKPDLIKDLIGLGLDAGTADSLASGWGCELVAKGKQIPASGLCKLYDLGVIDQPELYRRLINLNYDSDNAVLLVRECEIRHAQREQATQKRLLAESVRKEQEREKQRQRMISDGQKQRQRSEGELQRAVKVSERRKKQRLEAAYHFTKHSDYGIGEAYDLVEGLVNSLTRSGPYPIDSVLESVVRVTQLSKVKTPDDLSSELTNLMEAEFN